MLSNILEKLTLRKAELAHEQQTAWSQLVVRVSNGKDVEPDAVLSELAILDKTPEELAAAVELLESRRAWRKQLDASAAAEKEYPEVLTKIEAGERKLESLIETHHEKMHPVLARKAELIASISAAIDSRRNLIDTANTDVHAASIALVEREIEDVTNDRDELNKRIGDRDNWLLTVISLGDEASSEDQARVKSAQAELAAWRKQAAQLSSQMASLQDQYEKARDVLLAPECI